MGSSTCATASAASSAISETSPLRVRDRQHGEEQKPDEILGPDQPEPAEQRAEQAREVSQSGLCHNVSVASHVQPKHPGSGPGYRSGIPTHQRACRVFRRYSLPVRTVPFPSNPKRRKRGLEGTVIAVTGESVFLDIGFKTEGIIPLADFQSAGETVKAGDKIPVSIKGRDPEGYYELSRTKVERPKDWSSLEKAFADKTPIAGVVTAVVKGGVSVDVGVRAFMPASRSGARDAAEMEKLVGQEIRCRIIKLDVADEDVVVDRRAVLEEEERAAKERRYTEIKEGETVHGTVRSLTDYGAFVDIGGVDALLHVADISWGRVNKPADVLTVGPADRSQGAQGGCRQAAHFARHEAASAAPVGPGRARSTRPATACTARSRAWPISARSWSWRRASKG